MAIGIGDKKMDSTITKYIVSTNLNPNQEIEFASCDEVKIFNARLEKLFQGQDIVITVDVKTITRRQSNIIYLKNIK